MKSSHAVGVLKVLAGLAAVLLLLISAACSREDAPKAAETLAPEQEAALIQRVTGRWHAMEVRNFKKVYEFATPNYRRVFPKSLYINKFSYEVDWELTGVTIVNYDARAAVASVAVRVMSEPTKQTSAASVALGAVPITIREKWLKVDGEWWHSAKD
jgi:hypothetical protein